MTRAAWPTAINGVRYQIDLAGMIRRPLNQNRQLQDQGAEPGESTLATHNTWKRTQHDWSMGAGQDWFDQDVRRDRARFSKSKGVDVWSDRYLSLLPEATRSSSLGGTGTVAKLKRAGGSYVYGYVDGAGVHWQSDGTVTNLTGEAGTFSDLTTWDGYVYFAGSSPLRRVAVGSTAMSTFGTLTPDLIEAVNGRLLAADGSSLFEINAAGAKQGGGDIFVHPATNWTWTDLEGGPNGIYVAGTDGYTSTVFLVPVVDATGDLVAPYPVLPLPPGELVRELVHVSGVLVIATNRGVRLATINGSGFLGMAPVITDLGDVSSLAVDGNNVWASWSAEPIDGEVGLARLGPDRFTEPFVPRYASDLLYGDTGTVLACAVLSGQPLFIYDDGADTYLVNAHASNKVASGQLFSGDISFLTPEEKVFWGAESAYEALPAGSSVTTRLYVGDVAQGANVDTTTGSTSSQFLDSTPVTAESAEVELELTRATDATVSPVVTRWSLLATPKAFRTEEIILPIILKEFVDSVSMDLDAEWEVLHALFLSQARVSLEFGSKTETVTVDAIATEPSNAVGSLVDWNHGYEWPHGVWLVRLLTQEA